MLMTHAVFQDRTKEKRKPGELPVKLRLMAELDTCAAALQLFEEDEPGQVFYMKRIAA